MSACRTTLAGRPGFCPHSRTDRTPTLRSEQRTLGMMKPPGDRDRRWRLLYNKHQLYVGTHFAPICLRTRAELMLQALRFTLLVNHLNGLRKYRPDEVLAVQERLLRRLLQYAAKHSPF